MSSHAPPARTSEEVVFMPPISRRRFLVTTSGAVAGALAPAVGRAQTSVKIGTAVLGDYALAGPFIVATEKGFFRNENLNVEFVPFRGGPNLVKAVIAGEVLLGAAGSTDIFVFREAGMPLKMVATHTEGNHFTFNVAPEVQGVADLKGKAIGVTGSAPRPGCSPAWSPSSRAGTPTATSRSSGSAGWTPSWPRWPARRSTPSCGATAAP
jgi:hypothetical protein